MPPTGVSIVIAWSYSKSNAKLRPMPLWMTSDIGSAGFWVPKFRPAPGSES